MSKDDRKEARKESRKEGRRDGGNDDRKNGGYDGRNRIDKYSLTMLSLSQAFISPLNMVGRGVPKS